MNREIVDDDIWAPVPRESDLWRYGIAAIEHIPQPIKEENVSKKEFFFIFYWRRRTQRGATSFCVGWWTRLRGLRTKRVAAAAIQDV